MKERRQSLTQICKRHKTTFWGQKYFVTPALVSEIFGDGRQLIYLAPINTRPNYYVVRIDSKTSLDNWAANPFCDTILNEVLDAIEEQYGRETEEWDHDNGRTYTRHFPFPALEWEGGEWGFIGWLRSKNRVSERLPFTKPKPFERVKS